jgi:hypothetical protein
LGRRIGDQGLPVQGCRAAQDRIHRADVAGRGRRRRAGSWSAGGT